MVHIGLICQVLCGCTLWIGVLAEELPEAVAVEEGLAVDEACSGRGEEPETCAISALQAKARQTWAAQGVVGVEHQLKATRAEDLLQEVEQVSPCPQQAVHPCVDGYRPHRNCKAHFSYNGRDYSGCTTAGSWMGIQWCSHDSVYKQGSYERCGRCLEKAVLPIDRWANVASQLSCLTFSLLVGNAKRRTYEFENGQSRVDRKTWMASAGKWPVAVAIVGAVRSGHLQWETRANEVFDWWTKDPLDARSGVTLRNLLQFASGFETEKGESDSHGWDIPCMQLLRSRLYSLEGCAHQIYEQARHGPPGRKFSYNSFHLQIALAMAVKRTGIGPQQFLSENLFKPAQMNDSSVLGGHNPLVATFMFASGADYGSFLRKYLAYELLPKSFCDVMETPGRHAGNPNFGMGFEILGSELRWGGNVHPYLDRHYGVYAVVMPKEMDYLKYHGFAGQENPFGEYIGVGHDIFPYIRDTVYRLGAL